MSNQDVLSSTLGALRISGNLLLDTTYGVPWSIGVPGSPDLSRLLQADPEARVVAFHAADRGEFAVTFGHERVAVGPGELVAVFSGRAHILERGGTAETTPLQAIMDGTRRLPPADRPDVTKLLSGAFVLHDTALNPMVAALPSIQHARLIDGPLEPVTRILRAELHSGGNASGFMVDRALEMLCAALIRQHLEDTPDEAVGFFRGLKDPRLCRALEQVHRNPRHAWSVEDLARQAGLSRSRFSARFNELLGEGPMAYVTRWRMNTAARHLRRGERSVAEVAASVGYESVPAFTRVFKRSIGTPPARFRDRDPSSPALPAARDVDRADPTVNRSASTMIESQSTPDIPSR